MVQLQRLTDLSDATGVQHHDFVGQRHRLDLIVGDVNHRAAQTFMQARNFNTHLHAQRGVQVRERFIQQKHTRLRHQRAANRYALTLPAGKRFWLTFQQMRQLQHFRHLVDALIHYLFFGARQLEAERHVFCNGEMGIERIRLEYHAHAALGRRDIIHTGFPDKQVATGDGFKPGDHTQQGRFTTA
ncbi:Uncharacterised protein [Salmonella enterica subsp. enterica serovar Bovismorbificans]|uniref:Uncharacterized protein n=1 Tax=Salmonella enterica subsp. enterica serovar Bovismorbificans TaxID=58097 RepID=A0A655EM56_SALET|nr:Uncharacterised protein [Salmonella enterica subsp. enterica serovar Bovismorbificans]